MYRKHLIDITIGVLKFLFSLEHEICEQVLMVAFLLIVLFRNLAVECVYHTVTYTSKFLMVVKQIFMQLLHFRLFRDEEHEHFTTSS